MTYYHMIINDIWSHGDYAPMTEKMRPAGEKLAEKVAGMLPTGASIADIGAGHGEMARSLADRGFKVTAVEPAEKLVEEGKARTGDAVSWLVGSAEELDLPDNSQDAVVSAFGLIYAAPPPSLAQAARVLKPGGLLAMTVMGKHGFRNTEIERMLTVLPDMRGLAHLRWGNEDWGREQLARHFTDFTSEEHSYPWEFGSVAEALEFYDNSSPIHYAWYRFAEEKNEDMRAVVEAYLNENARPDGTIKGEAPYRLYTARVK